jgi:hypothetical protein
MVKKSRHDKDESSRLDTTGSKTAMEHDAANLNRIMLFIFLWSRDVLRLTGSHLIASRSNDWNVQ